MVTAHHICSLDTLTQQHCLSFDINSHALFAVISDTKVFVYRNICPHLGVCLEWQPNQFLDSSQSLIQCSTHGALFKIETGHCIAGPCVGQSLTPIEHRIIDGQLIVDL